MLRVVSPLALTPRVERSPRFIFGSRSDMLTPPRQTLALWGHWGPPAPPPVPRRPRVILVEREVRDLLIEAFAWTALLDRETR